MKVPVLLIEDAELRNRFYELNETEREWFEHLFIKMGLDYFIVQADKKEKENGSKYKIKNYK